MNAPLVYLGLGANLGDGPATLRQAVAALQRIPDLSVVAGSPFYRSAPVEAAGPDYTNAVCAVRTTLAPEDLLDQTQAIERDFGRTRPYHNAPRTLDIDLLFYGNQSYQSERLILPHPRWAERAFVLYPLRDLNPDPSLLPASWSCLFAAVADQRLERLPGPSVWTTPAL